MECKAFVEPDTVAQLVAELEGSTCKTWRQTAFFFKARSVDSPGRKLLWVIPRDVRAGANPELWLREHQELLNELVDRSVAYTTVVFPGAGPNSVKRYHVEVQGRIRREVRCLSAPCHVWADRLRLYDKKGDIDMNERAAKLNAWAGRYWTKEKEQAYINPKFELVEETGRELAERAKKDLLDRKPRCLEKGYVVIYGQGGAGKTYFLTRLAHRLAKTTVQNLTSSIPVYVRLAGVLHQHALENWLSENGFGVLTLSQLTTLLRRGVILPLLDALDEVVKGEARRGSDEFLGHSIRLASGTANGRGVLVCRDYYLTADRTVVRDRVRAAGFPEICILPFDEQDTRSFLQKRTRMSADHVSRWAGALEREAKKIVGEEKGLEVIRHPIVLDTFAEYILKLPPASRITDAESFRLTRQDIFGEIVDQLLTREKPKLAEPWERAFKKRLDKSWMDPFTYVKQREIFRKLTLLVAEDGGSAARGEVGRTELRHGIFLTTKGVPSASTPRDAFEKLLWRIVGSPAVAGTVPEEDRAKVQSAAIKHMADVYAGHILMNTQPNLPQDLVCALRHRFYFDYFLADALFEQLGKALTAGNVEILVEWCMKYHVADSFATCLDFLSWDTRVTRDGAEQLRNFLRDKGRFDELLASYLISLGLALLLRRRHGEENRIVHGLQCAAIPEAEIMLVNEFLPEELSGFAVVSSSFPRLVIDSLSMKEVRFESCDFKSLTLAGSTPLKVTRCSFNLECDEFFQLKGHITLSDTRLDIDGHIAVGEGAHIELYECVMNNRVLDSLQEAKKRGADITLFNPKVLEEVIPSELPTTPGRRFINRLMVLLRKEGHSEFAVYKFKLRDKTPGTDEQFARAMLFLVESGCVRVEGVMVIMTDDGASKMYHPRLADQPDYDARDAYWQPIIEELDTILAG